MKQFLKWTGLVLIAAVIGLALAVVFAAGAQARWPVAVVQRALAQATPPSAYGGTWDYWPGGYGASGVYTPTQPYGYWGGYGPGMTLAPALRSGASAGVGRGWGGYGYGGWGMGPGMMGPYGRMGVGGYGGYGVVPQGTPVPVDQEIQLATANFRFDPATVTVRAGETVRLVVANTDGVPHNVYGSNLALAYTLLPSGVSRSVTFTAPTTPGTYQAVCTFHPAMTLEIVVK